jgi:hypothetical protein
MSNYELAYKIKVPNFSVTARDFEKSKHWKQDPVTGLYDDTNPYLVTENKGWTKLPKKYSTMSDANKAEQILIDTLTKLGLTKVTQAKVA